MSEPKRYRPFLNQQGGRYVASMDCPSMKEDERGEWVSLADYARLKAEVERLEKIVGSDAIDRKYGMCCDASDEIARLKAEVERLTKAVMHSPAAQLKLKELEGKTTFEDINPKGGQP